MCCFYFHSTGTLSSASHFFFATGVLESHFFFPRRCLKIHILEQLKHFFFIITTALIFTSAPQFTVFIVFSRLVSPVTASCFCFTRRRLHPSRDLLGGRRLRQAVRTSAALRRRQTHGRKKNKTFSFSFPGFVLCWSAVSKHMHAKTTRRLMEIKRN